MVNIRERRVCIKFHSNFKATVAENLTIKFYSNFKATVSETLTERIRRLLKNKNIWPWISWGQIKNISAEKRGRARKLIRSWLPRKINIPETTKRFFRSIELSLVSTCCSFSFYFTANSLREKDGVTFSHSVCFSCLFINHRVSTRTTIVLNETFGQDYNAVNSAR